MLQLLLQLSVLIYQLLHILIYFRLALISKLDVLLEVVDLLLQEGHLVALLECICLYVRYVGVFLISFLLPLLPFFFNHLLVDDEAVLADGVGGHRAAAVATFSLVQIRLFPNHTFDLIVGEGTQIGVLRQVTLVFFH